MVGFLTTTNALLALLTGFTAATPLTKRAYGYLAPNTQSCVTTQELPTSLCYAVNVGVTFANGVGCEGIGWALKTHLLAIPGDKQTFSAYSCVDDGNGYTLLKFTTFRDRATQVNEILQQIYPMVNGFNYPQN
ncbi:hypothetical protein LTR56_021129 [Elasticomyces elasticus]|nr:hypothetical protein LTR56_021129 [Elasticomyces elasticus]KAK3631804.1 hypothetical protein LTR22_020872 [Elasticomyces elasticus]KAK4909660.1 hypothetical protein LTR49_021554 [Elasticomyces elasticus]KAK5749522.1 hypothetical protein LTS12_020388 [Elasticomyces elasticus]